VYLYIVSINPLVVPFCSNIISKKGFSLSENRPTRQRALLQASKSFEQAIAADDRFALAHARLAEVWTELDYSGGLNGKGLTFNNPNASRTCSCGESFAV